MPTITDIKPLKRHQSRFSVFVDGKYAFGISDLELSAQEISIGQDLSLADVMQWKERDGLNKTINMAIRFVSVRARSHREILDYLSRKGIDEEAASEAVERLDELGLADDVAFAEGWVAGRQRSRPRSRRRLEQELAAKGVPKDVIASVLEAGFDKNSELASLAAVVEKKLRQPQYHDPAKLTAYLLRQGYPYELVKRALESRED